MTYISNTLLLGSIDHMAAVVKAQLAVVSKTEDLYDKILREKNPDDIVNESGDNTAYASDALATAGTRLYTQFSSYIDFLERRAQNESYASLAALLLARGLRVPSTYNSLIQAGKNSGVYIDASLVFADTAVTLGSFAHGGSFDAGTALSALAELAYVRAVVSCSVIGDADWDLDIDVTYSDDSEGTEAITVANTGVLNDVYPIGQLAITGYSTAGQDVALLSDTTGFVAGQKVLLTDTLYSTKLVANASSAQAVVYVDEEQVGAFRPGDAITLRDGSANENLTILAIDYDSGKITFTGNLVSSYTTAASAFIYLQSATGVALRPGWQEIKEIKTVTGSTSLTFTENLQHSYYTTGKVTRLIKTIEDVATNGATGSAGDSVNLVTVVERTPTQ